jgi:hypothetical protein
VREESDRDRDGEGGDHRAEAAGELAEELRRGVRAVEVGPLGLSGHREDSAMAPTADERKVRLVGDTQSVGACGASSDVALLMAGEPARPG